MPPTLNQLPTYLPSDLSFFNKENKDYFSLPNKDEHPLLTESTEYVQNTAFDYFFGVDNVDATAITTVRILGEQNFESIHLNVFFRSPIILH